MKVLKRKAQFIRQTKGLIKNFAFITLVSVLIVLLVRYQPSFSSVFMLELIVLKTFFGLVLALLMLKIYTNEALAYIKRFKHDKLATKDYNWLWQKQNLLAYLRGFWCAVPFLLITQFLIFEWENPTGTNLAVLTKVMETPFWCQIFTNGDLVSNYADEFIELLVDEARYYFTTSLFLAIFFGLLGLTIIGVLVCQISINVLLAFFWYKLSKNLRLHQFWTQDILWTSVGWIDELTAFENKQETKLWNVILFVTLGIKFNEYEKFKIIKKETSPPRTNFSLIQALYF